MINSAWSKESRLSKLKTELASVERKIQLYMAVKSEEELAEQTKKETPNVLVNIVHLENIYLP